MTIPNLDPDRAAFLGAREKKSPVTVPAWPRSDKDLPRSKSTSPGSGSRHGTIGPRPSSFGRSTGLAVRISSRQIHWAPTRSKPSTTFCATRRASTL